LFSAMSKAHGHMPASLYLSFASNLLEV
jgi:hypothetical protein